MILAAGLAQLPEKLGRSGVASEPVPLPKTCSHWLPDGSFVVLIGRHGGMNPEATLQNNADR